MKCKKVLFLCGIIIILITLSALPIHASYIQPRSEFGVSMWLVSYTGNALTSSASSNPASAGHSFLVFHNESTRPVRIGHMNVGADDYVTIGTFGNRSSHVGIWYNIEGYVRPTGCIAMCTYIDTEAELSSVNAVINAASSNNFDESDAGDNCADFAVKVWNAVGLYKFIGTDYSNSELYSEIYQADGEYPVERDLAGDPVLDANGNPIIIYIPNEVVFNYTPPSKSRFKIAYHTATSVVYSEAGAVAH